MHKKLFAIALLSLAPVAFAQDSWTGADKPKHFIGSVGLGAAAVVIAPRASFAEHFALALAPGVLKEIHDSRPGGSGFSVKDLAWDMAGAYLGVSGARIFISPGKILIAANF